METYEGPSKEAKDEARCIEWERKEAVTQANRVREKGLAEDQQAHAAKKQKIAMASHLTQSSQTDHGQQSEQSSLHDNEDLGIEQLTMGFGLHDSINTSPHNPPPMARGS